MSGAGIAKGRGGRPPERDEPKRAPINMRTTPTIRAALQAAADDAGRSLAQEIEQRLERSLELDEELGGSEGLQLFRDISAAVRAVGGLGSWRSDVAQFASVRTAVLRTIDAKQPRPSELLRELEKLFTAQGDGDKERARAARIRIVDIAAETATIHQRAVAAADIAVDLINGFTKADRAGAEKGMQLVERIIAGAKV